MHIREIIENVTFIGSIYRSWKQFVHFVGHTDADSGVISICLMEKFYMYRLGINHDCEVSEIKLKENKILIFSNKLTTNKRFESDILGCINTLSHNVERWWL